jgi:RNA polymerase subunit RPABC4/transcription elongation factor Spt4
MTDSLDRKTCPRCERSLPLDGFHRDRTRADGRRGHCRDCSCADEKTRREERAAGARYVLVPEAKTCPSCGESLAAAEFGPDPTRPDGLQGMCGGCQADRSRRRYAEDRAASDLFRALVEGGRS